MADLVPDLQHILFWMANSIELLYFIQQKSPLYMQSMEDELDVTGMASCAPGSAPSSGTFGHSGGFTHTCLHSVELSWSPGQSFGDSHRSQH